MSRIGSKVFAFSAVALSLLGCGETETFTNPDVFSGAALTDTNADADIVEVELVAGPSEVVYLDGRPANVWAYRDGNDPLAAGSVPGPLLEAKLGDRIIVHFRNDLPVATTVHWHGIRVPNSADGTLAVQKSIAPGESFDYRFTAIDAGLFWYHPHVAGDVQIERGLYAPVLIHGGKEPDVTADRVLVLDDVKLDADGQLSKRTDGLDLMLGRQGNVLLVNGEQRPTLSARTGGRERWRLLNSANGRFFNLELPGHVFQVIAWDGGLLPEPYRTRTLLIAPGERYEVLVELGGSAGDTLTLKNVYYDRGHNIPDNGPVALAKLRLEGAPRTLKALPRSWGKVTPLPVDEATPESKLVLEENDDDPTAPMFSINGEFFPDVTPLLGVDGQLAIWEVENRSEMDHPFHVHGMFFQLLDVANPQLARLGWKDTVNVPREGSVRFAMRYEGVGHWMYHCHILEHAERGMMGHLMISKPAAQP